MKNVYPIITDLHFSYKEKDNRNSYISECLYVKKEILSLVYSYKAKGFNVTPIFLGDIYDNSFKDVERAMVEFDYMVYLKKACHSLKAVMGNHEFSYKKDNPFWALVSTIDSHSPAVKSNRITPLGVTGVLDICDRFEDGEVVFNFNHYGSSVLQPVYDKVNIGLFHQNIVCRPAVNSAINRGLSPYETTCIQLEENDVLSGYNYSFFGHFHKYYGKWQIDNGRFIYYLGSLGRPNNTEVSDNFLERKIPCVIVEDGKFVGVEDYVFNLMDRGECVKEDVILEQKMKREKRKEVMKDVGYDVCSEDVIASVKEVLNHEIYHHIIDSILNDDLDLYYQEMRKRCL